MKLIINFESGKLIKETKAETLSIDLYSKKSFELISKSWLKVGWNQKYTYSFCWMGRPIIQLPEDMIRIQEVIYRLKPDVIIETGIAHGGSLIYYASICKAMQRGRIIGIDIEIRPHNRRAIESHELFPYITLIEGNSTDKAIVDKVRSLVNMDEMVLIILDSNHTKQHVLKELDAYHDMVTPDSYIVVTDGIMKYFHDVPRGNKDWLWNNPTDAALEFLKCHEQFILERPFWPFNESELNENITYWSDAWLKRIKIL